MSLQEHAPVKAGQELIDKVIALQKTVQKVFRLFVAFFLITFFYFTAIKIHENGFVIKEVLVRIGFMVVAISLATWTTGQIRKQFLKYVKLVGDRELNLSFKEQSKASLLSNLSEGILEYDIGSKQWMTVTIPFLNIFRVDWFKFMRGSKGDSAIASWYTLVHPDDLVVAKSMLERRFESTGVDRCQLRMINNVNEIRLIDVGLASIIESNAHGILIISHRDITELKRTEQQKQLLTSIVEESPDAYWIFDDEGMNLYTSPSAKKILTLASEHQCRELEFMNDPIALKAQLLVHLNPGTPFKRIVQSVSQAPAGVFPPFILISGFMVDGVGEHNYHVVTVKDISDAYQRELEVKNLKDRMELAMGAASIGAWEWDLNTHQMSWDSHLYDIFQLNPQIKPTYELLVSKIVSEDVLAVRTCLGQVMDNQNSFDLQFRIKTLTGEIRHIKGVGQKIKSEANENRSRMFGIFWDITQEMSAREELAHSQLRQQNSARLAALGEMASGVAHEINNPLSVISARASLLRMKIKQSVSQDQAIDYQAALESIETNVVRISKIIKGLRTFSRDGDKDPFQQHDLSQLTDDIMGVCGERFRSSGVKIEITNRCSTERRMVCRGVQIAQVLVNLINNAFDAALNSEAKLVRLEIYDDGQGMHFVVSDSGDGVPVHLEEKIMQPFFTTKEVGKGTGLGLSISQAIVRDHGGRLYLDRAISPSCFHVMIPMLEPRAEKLGKV